MLLLWTVASTIQAQSDANAVPGFNERASVCEYLGEFGEGV